MAMNTCYKTLVNVNIKFVLRSISFVAILKLNYPKPLAHQTKVQISVIQQKTIKSQDKHRLLSQTDSTALNPQEHPDFNIFFLAKSRAIIPVVMRLHKVANDILKLARYSSSMEV